jgi:hypothetical protein
MSWSVCPLLGGNNLESILFISPVQIYETLYLLLRVQECRFITPSQGAGLTVLCMGDGILTHSSVLEVPRPNSMLCFGFHLLESKYSLISFMISSLVYLYSFWYGILVCSVVVFGVTFHISVGVIQVS